MQKIKITLLVLAAFTAGLFFRELAPFFLTNHTEVYKDLSQSTKPIVPPLFQSSSQSASSAPLLTERDQAPATQGSQMTQGSVKESFSWPWVRQLIASQRYDEALTLLQDYVRQHAASAEAWLALAQIYEKQNKWLAAMDAWFRYVDVEASRDNVDRAKAHMKSLLLNLSQHTELFGNDTAWLIRQFDELLKLTANDGELHLALANLYVAEHQNDQAEYHALIALNDPATQRQAQQLLAQLKGPVITADVKVPLIKFGQHFIVEVMIEGSPARLLLDTGASITGISNVFIAKNPALVRDKKPIRLNTANGAYDSYFFTVNSFSFGDIQLTQHAMTMINMDKDAHIDGLFGMDVLGRFDYTVDQDASVLRLSPRKNP